jgi:xanthine dehydrogenase YagS FAD-binding subunit
MLSSFAYARPKTLSEAVDLLSAEGARAHAGGTDLLGCCSIAPSGAWRSISFGAVSSE